MFNILIILDESNYKSNRNETSDQLDLCGILLKIFQYNKQKNQSYLF